MSSEPMAVVLAAGKGTRMKSDLPKVLFPVLGRAMIHWVLDALNASGIQRTIVVVGYRSEDVRSELSGRKGVSFALQAQQLGDLATRWKCAARSLPRTKARCWSSPAIRHWFKPARSEKSLMTFAAAIGLACWGRSLKTIRPDWEESYELREVTLTNRIVEHKDATLAERTIKEVNMSTYLFKTPELLSALSKLENSNAKRSLYPDRLPTDSQGQRA